MNTPADAIRRTALRYRRCDRFTRHYVASKLRMDPVHAAVLALAAQTPFGQVADIGSGRGQLGVALLEAGLADAVLALDHDAHALTQLQHAAAGLDLRTERIDLATTGPTEPADTVLLIDVLYQLASPQQLGLLRRAASLARHTVIIRATDPALGWRSTLSTLLERLGRHWWPTFGPRINPLPIAALVQALQGCGYQVRVTPCADGTPLAGVLVIGQRGGEGVARTVRSALQAGHEPSAAKAQPWEGAMTKPTPTLPPTDAARGALQGLPGEPA